MFIYRNIVIFSVMVPHVLFALPSGGSVSSGGATISTNTSSVVVDTEQNVNIINWDSFSLNNGESVIFSRSGNSSTDAYHVFNKVTGSSISTINGNILSGSNGSIYIVNPNGVVIGPNGNIVTGGCFISSLDNGNTFNLNTNMTFSGTGTVSHFGSITGSSGDVVIIGYRVTTEDGSQIHALNNVALASGASIVFQPLGAERVYIQSAGSFSGGSGIDHQGAVSGSSIFFKADGNIYSLAINMEGVIRATSCSTSSGRILLHANPLNDAQGAAQIAGSIMRECTSTSTGSGPSVEIYGHSIALLDGSSINVSGLSGGGVTIGTNNTSYSTNFVYISPSSVITSTGTSGSGGNISIYGSESILYLGTTNVSSSSLNGGMVTLNSGGYLGINGSANLSSAMGANGTFTATNSIISVGGNANYGTNFSPENFTIQSVDSVFTKISLEQILANANVVINGESLFAITNDINWTSGNSLSLIASNQIEISKLFSMQGSSFSGVNIFSMTAPIIEILSASDVGVDILSGDILVDASNYLLLKGAASGFSKIKTGDGAISVSFGNNLNMRGSGGEALIQGSDINIDSKANGIGDISLEGEGCGRAKIVGSDSVVIGDNFIPRNMEIIAGYCGSGLISGIFGGEITAVISGDLEVIGGVSGTGNIATIETASGDRKDITLTAGSISVDAGASGINNSAQIINHSGDGIIALQTDGDFSLNAGGGAATASTSRVYSNHNTFLVEGDFGVYGGDGINSYAGIYGHTGNIIYVSGNIDMYSGNAAGSHAQIETSLGDIDVRGAHIRMHTQNSREANVFITSDNGSVNIESSGDFSMRGSCTIPNKAYVYADGANGNVSFTTSGTHSRINNVEVLANGGGDHTHTESNYLLIECSNLSSNPLVATSAVNNNLDDYYKYTFLYELMYRMHYFGMYDWYLFHSSDFWLKHTFTSP